MKTKDTHANVNGNVLEMLANDLKVFPQHSLVIKDWSYFYQKRNCYCYFSREKLNLCYMFSKAYFLGLTSRLLTISYCRLLNCKNFTWRYAWISVTFLGFISFEQVTGNNKFHPWDDPNFRKFNWFKWVYVPF